MKRSKFGAVLLVFLLATGIFISWSMKRCHTPISQDLEQAAQAALAEDWAEAAALTDRASAGWQQCWRFSAALADHEPMEEIDSMFAELEVYLQAKDSECTAAVCAELARRVEDMSDAHRLNWWNLL